MKSKLVLTVVLLFLIGLNSFGQNKGYNQIGVASFYADKFEGRKTANGEIYYHAKKTAAHKTLAFGSIVKVTNLENNKYVVVRINDRGPFVDNRIIDLSKSAARELDIIDNGLAKVRVELIANTDELPDKVPQKAESDPKVYYRIEADLSKPKGKGVQIGSYTDDDNMLRIISELQATHRNNVFVEVANVNNKKLYRVIVGAGLNESELENLKKKLKKRFPDCFIVEYKN